LDGRVDRKAAKVAKERGEEGVSEDGFSDFRSFGAPIFSRLLRFHAFRGFLDGELYRKAAKVAKGRKEEGNFF
jgi:hypothetical protein